MHQLLRPVYYKAFLHENGHLQSRYTGYLMNQQFSLMLSAGSAMLLISTSTPRRFLIVILIFSPPFVNGEFVCEPASGTCIKANIPYMRTKIKENAKAIPGEPH